MSVYWFVLINNSHYWMKRWWCFVYSKKRMGRWKNPCIRSLILRHNLKLFAPFNIVTHSTLTLTKCSLPWSYWEKSCRLSCACHITLSVLSSTSTNLSGKYKLYDLSLHNCIQSPRISYLVTFFSAPLLKDDCFRGRYSSQLKKKQKNKKLSLSYLHNRVLNHILMLLTSSQEPTKETAGGFLCLLQLANKLSDVTCKKMSHEAEYVGETHHHSVLGFLQEFHLGFLCWSWQEFNVDWYRPTENQGWTQNVNQSY